MFHTSHAVLQNFAQNKIYQRILARLFNRVVIPLNTARWLPRFSLVATATLQKSKYQFSFIKHGKKYRVKYTLKRFAYGEDNWPDVVKLNGTLQPWSSTLIIFQRFTVAADTGSMNLFIIRQSYVWWFIVSRAICFESCFPFTNSLPLQLIYSLRRISNKYQFQ